MDILTLIDKRNNLMDEAEKFLTEKTTENGGLSENDAKTYAEMEKNIDAVTENIERFQRQNARNSSDGSFTRAPIRPELPGNTGAKVSSASDEYRKAAVAALRTKFKNVSNLLQEQVAADGGYLVPEEWASSLIEILREDNIMRKLARTINTTGEHKMPFPATPAQAYLVTEGSPIPTSNMTFGQKTLSAYKIAVDIVVTNELLYDNAFDLENYIIEEVGRALADKEEELFITGTGSINNQPTGILTTAASDPTMVRVTTGANIASDDLLNLIHDLPRSYRKKAAFLVNDATFAAIRKLKDNTLNYLWEHSMQAGEPEKLFGYPVYSSRFMPTIAADEMVIAFGDFSRYTIADRGEKRFQQLNELHAANFCTGYIMAERVDGVLLVNDAIRVLKIKP